MDFLNTVEAIRRTQQNWFDDMKNPSQYSTFSVPAKVTKLVGLKNKGGLSPINLVTFAITQNGE